MASPSQESSVTENVDKVASELPKSPGISTETKSPVETLSRMQTTDEAISTATSPVISSSLPQSPLIPTSPTSPTSATSPREKKLPIPPPGYKYVKVVGKDGAIKTVKRKLSPEELAAASLKSPVGSVKSVAGPSTTPKVEKAAIDSKPKDVDPKSPTESVKAISTNEPAKETLEKKSTEASEKTTKEGAVTSTREVPSETAVQPENSISHEEALAAQDERFRKGRFQKFRRSLGMGLSTLVGSALPSVDLDVPRDGDEEVHDDPDEQSEIDDDDNHHDDHQNNNDGTHVQIQTGAMATAVAAGMLNKSEEKGPTATVRPIENGDKSKEKSTYGLTMNKLKDIESQRAEENEARQLQRHWANFSFYLIASLAIILPLLFMILGIAIALMKGKSTFSNWHKIEQANKFAISAWPIVFAAVVAQAFKSYATYQVERGIKLMRLEQLIGSTSFGNALKQPFLLRRINLLAFGLFLIWCLSPIGSQGLQRAIGSEPYFNETNTNVSYINTYGSNQLWSASVNQDDTVNSTMKLEIVSDYLNSALLPMTERDNTSKASSDQDRYDNPMMPRVDKPPAGLYSGVDLNYTSAYGVPFIFPELRVKIFNNATLIKKGEDPLDPYAAGETYSDIFFFNMTASYYNFTCNDWTQQIGLPLYDSSDFLVLSDDGNIMMSMTPPNADSTITNYLAFGSLNRQLSFEDVNHGNQSFGDSTDWEKEPYSFIECTYNRVFVNTTYGCDRSTTSGYNPSPICIIQENSTVQWHRDDPEPLSDFSNDFLAAAQITQDEFLSSGLELYLNGGVIYDDPNHRAALATFYNLSASITPEQFEWYFAFVFNTLINLAYCPECVDADGHNYLPPGREMFYTTYNTSIYWWGPEKIYTIDAGWLAAVFLTAGTLVIVGVASITLESRTVAPDTLGYISTAARNSKYLTLPPTTSVMSGPERATHIGGTVVMMQDVKGQSDVGKIVLGNKYDGATPLKPGRVYR